MNCTWSIIVAPSSGWSGSKPMKARGWLLLGVAVAGLLLSIVLFNFVRAFILRPADPVGAYRWTEVIGGLSQPVYVTHAGDDSGRLFVVEQGGTIRVFQDGKLLEKPLLDVSALVSRDDSERGLLGLAFHPRFTQNGWFFINYTDLKGDTVVARYTITPSNANTADPQSAQIIITVDQPYPNHNAGQLAFGPDGYLYFGLGDGGSANDPHKNGQNPHVLLGKMLRLNVNSDNYTIPADNPFADDADFAPEIWAWGLRNPWRYSFDRATGDLYIADVGQNVWEEVNFQPADSLGGENYGWNGFEGSHPFSDTALPNSVVMPIAEYSHSDGCSITGGYVYRGAAIPALQGTYIFGDFCSGTTWMTRRDASGAWQTEKLMNTGRVISSFGEDQAGELYLVDYAGKVLRLEPAS